jgi:hypothetical protein
MTMSEYQRYEFMTVDRPLTRAQLDAVESLSSHIEASSTHALIEYHWGDFKHDPIKVLYKYFDGFLYWANWGTPRLALRFPHGILPDDLIDGYDLDDYASFIQYPDYDILDIRFREMQAPDEWTEYELGSLIGIREELMEGDLRALYIIWLASQRIGAGYFEYEDVEDDEEDEEDEDISGLPVPLNFGTLTESQETLAELLQVPEELLRAAAQHSQAVAASTDIDIAAAVKLLPQDRGNEYLVRLAHNEPGLSRLLVKELREQGKDKTSVKPPTGEPVAYTLLLTESKAMKAKTEREKREQEQLDRLRHLQNVHDHQEEHWNQLDMALQSSTGSSYDAASQLLIELRAAADQFKESQEFQERFFSWVQSYLRRPAFLKRLQTNKFPVPGA